MINLAIAVRFADYEIPILYARPEDEEQQYVRGLPVEVERVADTIRGKFQPMKGSDLRDMPEGKREEAKFVVGTTAAIKLDDEVTDKTGKKYIVIHMIPGALGQHRRAVVGLLKPDLVIEE